MLFLRARGLLTASDEKKNPSESNSIKELYTNDFPITFSSYERD